ncbi:protease modulator HflC [Pseudomonas sp. NY15435]|uniref:protease modulator HflC n=1 Tax=Pseudomonas sp. NY15435 TaxID=3400358 RepID=UPI003A861E64
MRARWPVIGTCGLIAALWLSSSSFYTLSEGQKALVIRMGAPLADIDQTPGPKFKLPFIDSLQYYDARLQMLASPPEEVILGDEKRLEVETYTRYRIADPLRFYQAVRDETQAREQLAQLVSTSLRRELGRVKIQQLLSDDRSQALERVRAEVAQRAIPLGIEVEEVRLHRGDLPIETGQAIFARMKSARQQEAKQLRAQGEEWAQQIQAAADSERTVILSQAQSQSAVTRGEADAEANRILSAAYARDPQFYAYYRALQSYSQSLAGAAPTLLLSPDSAMLRALKNGPPTKAAP